MDLSSTQKSDTAEINIWFRKIYDWHSKIELLMKHHDDDDDETTNVMMMVETICNALSLVLSFDEGDGDDGDGDEEDNNVKQQKLVEYSGLVIVSLDILVQVAKESKTLFVTSNAMECTVRILRIILLNKEEEEEENKLDDEEISTSIISSASSTTTTTTTALKQITSTAMHCLAALSQDASDDIKTDNLLPLIYDSLVHDIMIQYIDCPLVQCYSCQLLRELSNPLLQELVSYGSVPYIWNSNQRHPNDCKVQEHTCACLYTLLPIYYSTMSTTSSSEFSTSPPSSLSPSQIIHGLVPGMRMNQKELEVQKYSLLVMTRVLLIQQKIIEKEKQQQQQQQDDSSRQLLSFIMTTPKKKFQTLYNKTNNINNNNNDISTTTSRISTVLAQQGVLNAILTALMVHSKNEELAQIGCMLLKHTSRQSLEFCTAMINYNNNNNNTNNNNGDDISEREGGGGNDDDGGGGGIMIIVKYVMQSHLDSINIQDPAMACIRNLLSFKDSQPMALTTISPTSSSNGTTSNSVISPSKMAASTVRKVLSYKDKGNDIEILIHTVGLVMTIHTQDSAIQAYGCDLLARIAILDEYYSYERSDGNNNNDTNMEDDSSSSPLFIFRKLLFNGNAISIALEAMKSHRNHMGVQDRAVSLLLKLCSYPPALEIMTTMTTQHGEEEEEEKESSLSLSDDGSSHQHQHGDIKSRQSHSSLPLSLPELLKYTRVINKKESQERLRQLISILDSRKG